MGGSRRWGGEEETGHPLFMLDSERKQNKEPEDLSSSSVLDKLEQVL